MPVDNSYFYKQIENQIKYLPWYIEEFIDKKRRRLSPKTLLGYCYDFSSFFNWLSKNNTHTDPKQIPLDNLEKLRVVDIEDYLHYCTETLDNTKITVNRKLSSLKSLFRYLQNIAETDDHNPYLSRNVIVKIELNPVNESREHTANKLKHSVLMDDEYEEFRQFIAYDYLEHIKGNKRMLNPYLNNRERDTALVSLILGSGIRLSEVEQLDTKDLDMNKRLARVIRKGNKEQYVFFSEQARRDLHDYLKIRKHRYNLTRSNNALFVASQMGRNDTTKRLTVRAIQNIVKKYAIAFGKPNLTVHKLRHSFATRYHQQNNDIPKLKKQLGHEDVQTTMIYTHLLDNDLSDSVKNVDKHKD